MTFAEWYASKIAPQIEAQVRNLPVEHREPIRTASRLAMAECWNAALDAMKDELMKKPTWSFSPEQVEAICNVHLKTSTLIAR